MDPKPRTLASDAEHRYGRGSLVDENLEFMARLSLVEQALPMLRMSEVGEIAEALLDLLLVEARARAGVIWSRPEPTGILELSAARGDVRVSEERESWPGEPESLDEALHAGRTIVAPSSSETPGRIFLPCCDGDRLLAIARLSGCELEAHDVRAVQACEKLAELGAIALAGAGERAALRRSSLRDPLTNLPSRAFLDELAKTELQKARRFGRRICLLCVEIEGIELSPALVANVVACVARTVRTTDVVAVESESRYWVLLTDSDPIGGTVLKRRIAARLREALALCDSEPEPLVGLATFPHDGENLPALCRAAIARVHATRTSIVRELGIDAGTSLASIGERLRERALPMPGEIVSEAADLLVGELACRPRDRGLLFFAPGKESAAFLQPLVARGEAEVATDGFLATEGDTLPACSVVSALGLPPHVSADTSWIVRFGEAPPYALVAWPAEDDGMRPVFHSSDQLLVEHMTFRLRAEVGFGMRASACAL